MLTLLRLPEVSRCGIDVRILICVFVFVGSRERFPDATILVLTLRVAAGLDDVSSDVSCRNDVEDVLALELEEPVDNPGTAVGTEFSVLHWMCLLLVKCGFCHEQLQVVNVHCCFLRCLHFSIGCDYRCRVSGYPNSLQFGRVQIFPMCIDVPEATTIFSSSFFENGAGNDQNF